MYKKSPMFLIRNVRKGDLRDLLKLACHLDSYNLPADEKVLSELIRDSEISFCGRMKEASQKKFLFVAEETRTHKLVGCSLIIARHGTKRLPHLSFKVCSESKRSRFLKKTVRHCTLELSADSSGVTEIGGLVVLPRYRGLKERVGKQLSYVRFTYMTAHPKEFRRRVIVEYLPKLDREKGNRFWEALGKKYTKLSYHEADRLSRVNKEFILSLFPREKIYCSLLPDLAVRYLGVPGRGAKASLKMLEKIGFRFLGQVDPFDGGPHYGADFSHISLVRNTVSFEYDGTFGFKRKTISFPSIVMRETKDGIRALHTICKKTGERVYLRGDHANLLGLRGGEKVLVTPF